MKIKIQLLLITSALMFLSCNNELKQYENVQEMIDVARSEVEYISAENFKKTLDANSSYYLIDCRESDEFDSACIKGAINIPRGKIEEDISTKAPDHLRSIYVYCSDDDRAILVAHILPGFKYANVKFIEGGFNNWKVKYPLDVETNPQRGNGTKKAAKPAGGCGG